MGVFCTITDSEIDRLDKETFKAVESYIIESGLGSDKESFEVIKARLLAPPIFSAEEFAEEAIYVILAGGFRQAVAKRKFAEIMNFIKTANRDKTVDEQDIFNIFHNPNKARAIAKIWNGRVAYRDGFYASENKVFYLGRLPHIGEITRNHLARNLGISNVKYDVWIQRLGIALYGADGSLAAGFPLLEGVKEACDKMFFELERETGYDRGYIDVVLWKACQVGIFRFS
ncbi:MAG: hypothetical protein LBL52_00310 [Rickettsiales bacterium]|jgi:hypothetical protein|nr:hypothetical protein [Rickettsiales bacterium]